MVRQVEIAQDLIIHHKRDLVFYLNPARRERLETLIKELDDLAGRACLGMATGASPLLSGLREGKCAWDDELIDSGVLF